MSKLKSVTQTRRLASLQAFNETPGAYSRLPSVCIADIVMSSFIVTARTYSVFHSSNSSAILRTATSGNFTAPGGQPHMASPTIVSAQVVKFSWSAPVDDGGSAVTHYTIR